ncbi:MAG: tRNA (adenosine(37)-N6)-threonylcarbamoyltransferase complex dimerization subunit type 1 TsaB [Treponema sp.]|nr:tRNA (adenosine(37)-N6)-threonylcarbamoyltransferase complex dimerization subunit type 1 TsaB [Treponema sp.]
MNILAIDTACQVFSAALISPQGCFYTEVDAPSRHSELLMECIDSLCAHASLDASAIDLVACMKGPGSFTGLRIGYAAAKGLALSLGIPLVVVPTLDCMAHPFSAIPALVLPLIDAKKSQFYGALYRGGERLIDYTDGAPDYFVNELDRHRRPGENIILTGPGAHLFLLVQEKYSPGEGLSVDPFFNRGKALELSKLAEKNHEPNGQDANRGPLYLRKSDAELSQDRT